MPRPDTVTIGGAGHVRAVVSRTGVGYGGAGIARYQSAVAVRRGKAGRRVGRAVVDLRHAAVGQGQRERCRCDAGDANAVEAVVLDKV